MKEVFLFVKWLKYKINFEERFYVIKIFESF